MAEVRQKVITMFLNAERQKRKDIINLSQSLGHSLHCSVMKGAASLYGQASWWCWVVGRTLRKRDPPHHLPPPRPVHQPLTSLALGRLPSLLLHRYCIPLLSLYSIHLFIPCTVCLHTHLNVLLLFLYPSFVFHVLSIFHLYFLSSS